MKLDNDLVHSWIDKEVNVDVKEIKKKIIKNVKYIDPETFEARLKESTIRAFKKIIGDYVVIWDYKPYSSKRWVYNKIEQSLPRKPALVTYYTQSIDHILGIGEIIFNKKIRNIVVFDDAVYSGEQLINRILAPLSTFFSGKENVKFFVIVPFATKIGIERINALTRNIDLELYYSEIMPTLFEILTPSERNVLDKLAREEFEYLGGTLTFFDHRVADDHSFFEEVKKLIHLSPKPYSEDTTYGNEEKKEWDEYWRTYLNIIKKED